MDSMSFGPVPDSGAFADIASGFSGPKPDGGTNPIFSSRNVTAFSDIFNQISKIVGISRAGSLSAKVSEAAAQQELINAKVKQRQIRRVGGQIRGKQEAMGAAAGLETTTGTVNAVILDSARQAEEDYLLAGMAGKINANAIKYNASLAQMKNRSDLFGGVADLGGSLAKNSTILQDLWGRATA